MENFMYNEITRETMQAEYDAALEAEREAIEAEAAAMKNYLQGGNGCPDAAYEAAVEVRLAAKQVRINAWHNLQTANLEW